MNMLIKVCHFCSQHRFPLILPSLPCKTPESSKTHAVCTHQEQATSLNIYQVQSHTFLSQEVHLLTANCATHFMKSYASWNQCGLSLSNQYPADHESDDLSCPCHAVSILWPGDLSNRGVDLMSDHLIMSCCLKLTCPESFHDLLYSLEPDCQGAVESWSSQSFWKWPGDLGRLALPSVFLSCTCPELTFLLGITKIPYLCNKILSPMDQTGLYPFDTALS